MNSLNSSNVVNVNVRIQNYFPLILEFVDPSKGTGSGTFNKAKSEGNI